MLHEHDGGERQDTFYNFQRSYMRENHELIKRDYIRSSYSTQVMQQSQVLVHQHPLL